MALNHNIDSGSTMIRFMLILCFACMIARPAEAQSGNTQALTKDDLKQINQQPLVPSAKNPAGLGQREQRKPSFEYTDNTGTQIREYRESNLPTEIEVKSTFGTYEMSPPNTVMPTSTMPADGLISVPSIRIPLK